MGPLRQLEVGRGKILNATIRCNASEKYSVSLLVEQEVHELPKTGSSSTSKQRVGRGRSTMSLLDIAYQIHYIYSLLDKEANRVLPICRMLSYLTNSSKGVHGQNAFS